MTRIIQSAVPPPLTPPPAPYLRATPQVKSNGMDDRSLRDERYDGILHLVTAACGAEEHYSLENNEARSESVEMARDVSKTRDDTQQCR